MKRLITALAIVTALGLSACEVPEDEPGTAADRADTKGAAKEKAQNVDAAATGKQEKKKQDAPKETPGQANARESAAMYLDMTGFSRKGLIEQLEFEGFSTKDATYGVDAQHANWNDQAALSAKNYLDMSSFSRQGLIDQLKFEGYTQAQAEYGVKKVGL